MKCLRGVTGDGIYRVIQGNGMPSPKRRVANLAANPNRYVSSMLKIVPLSLKEANLLVSNWHRHHKPVRGCKFSIGVTDESGIHGAAICGRPSSRNIDYHTTLEFTRLVTDGTKNACSILYAASSRIAREMGYEKIISYILVNETGHSLKVSDWQERDEITPGRQWKHTDGNPRRTDQPTCDKRQFFKTLAPPNKHLHQGNG